MPKFNAVCFYSKRALREKRCTSKTVLRANAKSILRITWNWGCILATLLAMAWQLSNYYNGEDQTVVTYRMFNEIETDVYPSFTLCWTMTISDEKLKRYGSTFNATDYAKFLAGDLWDEKMLDVDYKAVTPDLDEYVLQYGYRTSKNRDEILYDKEWDIKLKSDFKKNSIWGMTCFTIDIPFEKGESINGFFVFLKSSIFGKQGRLANPDRHLLIQKQFHLHLHYRSQCFRRTLVSQRYWPFREPGSPRHYLMQIAVDTIDVLVRRNTYKNPCIEGVPEYDEKVVQYLL